MYTPNIKLNWINAELFKHIDSNLNNIDNALCLALGPYQNLLVAMKPSVDEADSPPIYCVLESIRSNMTFTRVKGLEDTDFNTIKRKAEQYAYEKYLSILNFYKDVPCITPKVDVYDEKNDYRKLLYVMAAAHRCIDKKTGEVIVVTGKRHYDGVLINPILNKLNITEQTHDMEQGFVDSYSRFLTREEAYQLASECNQVVNLVGNRNETFLFSEQLG